MKLHLKARWILFKHWFDKKTYKIRGIQMELDFIHQLFGLTYASWIVMPRVLMENMPPDWQKRFVDIWEEFNDTWDMNEVYKHGDPHVQLRKGGRFNSIKHTGLPHYRHASMADLEKFLNKYEGLRKYAGYHVPEDL